MAMNIKQKLLMKKMKKENGNGNGGSGKSKLNLRDKLKKNKPATATSSSLRNKFKKRTSDVLDRTYEDRNERSKGTGTGRPIFNQGLLKKFGIEDFSTQPHGTRLFDILPISFDETVPYFIELPVHFGIGLNNDAFICMNRFNNDRCYRCEVQQKMWRDNPNNVEEIKKLYPADRAVYLLWERTKELIDGESPDYTLQIWAAPKTKVHAEIQGRVRDKLTQRTLDISDLSIDGDGRTIGMNIVKQGNKKFPDYTNFELMDRTSPIPDIILEKLSKIIEYAEENEFINCIEPLLNFPEYNDLKTAMSSSEEFDSNSSSSSPEESSSSNNTAEEELLQELDQLQTELEGLNPLKWRKWLVENEFTKYNDMDKEQAIQMIINDLYEQEIGQ